MYARYPNYRFGGIKIPENYSGNAFRGDADGPPRAPLEDNELPQDLSLQDNLSEESATPEESVQVSLKKADEHRRSAPFGFRFDLGRLFSGGFGFEELLIIAVILLVSQNEAQRDLVLLLAILLFVG